MSRKTLRDWAVFLSVFGVIVVLVGCEKRIREPGSFDRPMAPLEEPADTSDGGA